MKTKNRIEIYMLWQKVYICLKRCTYFLKEKVCIIYRNVTLICTPFENVYTPFSKCPIIYKIFQITFDLPLIRRIGGRRCLKYKPEREIKKLSFCFISVVKRNKKVETWHLFYLIPVDVY